MTLKEANKKLEELNNDYNYWLTEKEIAQSIVRPKSSDLTVEKVDGGTRVDKMLKYAEILEDKQINETLDYIFKRRKNIMNWIDNELKKMKKYGEVVELIVQLKENTTIIDKTTHEERFLTWKEIAKRSHFAPDYCRQVYRLYKKTRDID